MTTLEAFTRPGLGIATAAFFTLAMLLPSVRLRLQSGTWGLVLHRAANPLQRTLGVAMAGSMLGFATWGAAYAAVGPEPLAVWAAPDSVRVAGWGLLGVAFLGVVVAQAQMGRSWRIGIDTAPTSLVTGGLFAWVRNPIFSGMLAAVAAITLITPSPWTIMGLAFASFAIALQVRLEEAHLLGLHGPAYRDYARRVGRFIPGVGRLRSRV